MALRRYAEREPGMEPDSQFSIRTFGHDGRPRLTAHPSLDVFQSQDHLIPVLDTIANASGEQSTKLQAVSLD